MNMRKFLSGVSKSVFKNVSKSISKSKQTLTEVGVVILKPVILTILLALPNFRQYWRYILTIIVSYVIFLACSINSQSITAFLYPKVKKYLNKNIVFKSSLAKMFFGGILSMVGFWVLLGEFVIYNQIYKKYLKEKNTILNADLNIIGFIALDMLLSSLFPPQNIPNQRIGKFWKVLGVIRSILGVPYHIFRMALKLSVFFGVFYIILTPAGYKLTKLFEDKLFWKKSTYVLNIEQILIMRCAVIWYSRKISNPKPKTDSTSPNYIIQVFKDVVVLSRKTNPNPTKTTNPIQPTNPIQTTNPRRFVFLLVMNIIFEVCTLFFLQLNVNVIVYAYIYAVYLPVLLKGITNSRSLANYALGCCVLSAFNTIFYFFVLISGIYSFGVVLEKIATCLLLGTFFWFCRKQLFEVYKKKWGWVCMHLVFEFMFYFIHVINKHT